MLNKEIDLFLSMVVSSAFLIQGHTALSFDTKELKRAPKEVEIKSEVNNFMLLISKKIFFSEEPPYPQSSVQTLP